MNFPAAAKPAVTRSETRRRKPRASTAANDKHVIAGEMPEAAFLGLLDFPYDIERVLQLHDDADGGEQQSAYPKDGCERAGGGTACACEHRLDCLRASVSQHPFQ